MREFKFRAWDGEAKKMWTPDIIDLRNGRPGLLMTYRHKKKTEGWMYDCVLMQFTGLYDKNGKEIYEGDRVSGTDINPDYGPYFFHGVIVRNPKKCCFFIQETRTLKNRYMDECIEIQVTGNIYESKEEA